MTSSKTKLASITNEVKELHPLLDKLLPKLPNIANVENTHGASGEMGADFVLAIKDDTFDTIDYLGIIAKAGKVAQDFTDIERQIDECSVPRFFFGGKEKVYLNEFWVIATGHITKNAQEKIHEKFRNRKIKFIDGKRLEKLIDKYLPNYWINVDLEVSTYLQNLHLKNKEIDKGFNIIADQNIYI